MKLSAHWFSICRASGRHLIFLVGLLCSCSALFGQSSGSITVGGSINTFYPVAWYDGNFDSNKNTHLELGRSIAHTDSEWRGALIAAFTFHTTNWGHGANFIDAHISTSQTSATAYKSFIAGWQDATSGNNNRRMIIWLRGGGTTYYYAADANVSPMVHDGVQNGLPYVSSNGSVSLNSKATVDSYVNAVGLNSSLPINLYGSANNFMQGNLGIGTQNPTEKLAVNGNIRAREIKVETANWPDYVFEEDYALPSLEETERFIQANKHLPNIPSAKEVEKGGVSLGEMNRLLLQKVEELTLHLIEKEKRIEKLAEEDISVGEMNRLLLQKVEELTLNLMEKEKRMDKLEEEMKSLKERQYKFVFKADYYEN